MAAWLQLVLLAGCVGGRVEIGEGQGVAAVFGRFKFQDKGMVVQGEVLQVEEAEKLPFEPHMQPEVGAGFERGAVDWIDDGDFFAGVDQIGHRVPELGNIDLVERCLCQQRFMPVKIQRKINLVAADVRLKVADGVDIKRGADLASGFRLVHLCRLVCCDRGERGGL